MWIALITLLLAATPTSQPAREVLFADDFTAADLKNWSVELQNGGTVKADDAKLLIDCPAGCTVWFRQPLEGPVMIEYEATVISAGGKNDRVSDLNCFWMARDARSPDDLFAIHRSGKFEDYNPLLCYYVGLGGNGNTTTRFRRYIGDKELRPLLPEHDLSDKPSMITPNVAQTIRLVASGKLIQFWRDDRRIFEMIDPQPYTSGHFGFRTTQNHMEIRHFQVYRIKESKGDR